MPDTVRRVDAFSIQVADRPGEAFKVLSALVTAGINLLACTGRPRGRRAQIDVVPADARKFNSAMRKSGLAFTPRKSGFLIQGEDRPGALAENLAKLAAAGVNVTLVDGLAAGAGRWAAILWVKPADVRSAARSLSARAR